MQKQIKRFEEIYEGSLFEFSTTIDLNNQTTSLKIEDLIYYGMTQSLGESKINELKQFYTKRIDKNYDFNNYLTY